MPAPLRVLAAVPRLKLLLPVSLLGRLHMTAMPVVLPFLLVPWTGSYTTAGFVGSVLAFGQAAGGPLRGRVADRGSPVRLLFVSGLLYATGMAGLLAVVHLLPGTAWPLALGISFVNGLAMPPVSQVSRALWQRLTPRGEKRMMLYTLDSTGNELTSIGGPLVASGALALSGPLWAALLCIVLATGGAVAFGSLMHGVVRQGGTTVTTPQAPAAGAGGGRSSLLSNLSFLQGLFVPLFLMASLFSVNLSMVGWAQQRGTSGDSGIMVALLSVGSLVGGLVVVARGIKVNYVMTIGLSALAMTVLALLLPPFSSSTPQWLIGLAVVGTGTMVSPSLAASYSQIPRFAPGNRQAEAIGWLATATTTGAGVTLPLTGYLLDASGPAASVASGALAALLAAVLAFTMPGTGQRSRQHEQRRALA